MQSTNHKKKKHTWNNVFTLLKPKRLQLFIIATCTILIYITSIVFPLSLQKGIDAALDEDSSQFYWMLSLSIVASIIKITLSNWRLITIINLGAYLELSLSGKFVKTILSRAYTKQQLSPGCILNATNRISHIKDFTLNTAPQTFLEVGQAVISFILIFHFSPTIAILTAAILAFSTLPLRIRSSNLPHRLQEYNIQENKKQNTVCSIAFTLKQIKYHALESFIYRKALHRLKNTTASLRTLLKVSSTIQLWGSLTSRTLTFIVFVSGCLSVKSNNLTIGEFMIIQLLVSRLSTLLCSTSDLFSKYQEAKTALDNMEFFNQIPAENSLSTSDTKAEENKIFATFNLTSQHPNGNNALQNINFELNSSGLIVFAGVSGSGKSTLAHTLMGLSGYSTGEIYYFGENITTLNIRGVRRDISVTDQDNYIFSGTLRENLCCGRTITNSQIFHTLDCVGLTSFVETLPESLDFFIDENGRELSGGQKQKICLARAFLKDSKCYILDEPTSALDSEATSRISSALTALSKTHLIICITHDPGLMKKANKIFFITKGSIIASGHHTELMSLCSDYKKMYTTSKNSIYS
ncbi:Vitamin B12 import ATP-binding protein BtuD [Pseudomonas fluorescens]|uniref:Vitamin B12 import ATP-binding protein BtuD n=1 Tax=Pseudomonas fluorescens TaxID=294 RepID=A0A5E7R1M0_PSEFL|nr:ABC transporter ATP-binding protein [Pseudomonas fluorescens]VVP65053.1 Vitamin B12 import ATP-binding protein BtuD [Pseudomonas fluorescens]